MDGRTDGQRAGEGETRKGYSQQGPAPSSLASGGRRRISGHRGQGAPPWATTLLGHPINTWTLSTARLAPGASRLL